MRMWGECKTCQALLKKNGSSKCVACHFCKYFSDTSLISLLNALNYIYLSTGITEPELFEGQLSALLLKDIFITGYRSEQHQWINNLFLK